MNIQLRTAILWILIVFCYLLHGYYHLAELFFGADIKVPAATGKVPLAAQLFSIGIEIVPLAIGVAALFVTRKWFLWFSFILAILLALLNLVHLAETVIKETGDIRQIALLTLIMGINILLVTEMNKRRKGPTSQI